MAATLSEEMYKEYKATFDIFDRNGDGCITVQELGDVMRGLGKNPTDDEIKKMISEVDKDNNGTVEFNEFIAMMNRKQKRDELREEFKMLDADGSGYITADELKKAMQKLGENIDDDDVKKMIAAADRDGDGKINWEEFVLMAVTK